MLACILAGMCRDFHPPASAEGRFVENQFLALGFDQNGEARVIRFGPKGVVSFTPLDALQEIPKRLGNKLGVLACGVQLRIVVKVPHGGELIRHAGIAHRGTEFFRCQPIRGGIGLSRSIGHADDMIIENHEVGIAH